MKKITALLLVLSINVFGQTGGKTGLSFLELGFGGRNAAMADLGVVTGTGASSQIYNPALIAENNVPQIMFNHQSLMFDVSNQIIGANFSLWNIPLAAVVQTTSISDIEVRLTPGDPIAKFNAHYFMAGISTGYEILNNLSAGITVKYIYEDLFTDNATGVGFDFGLYYKNLFKGLSLGASYRQLGSMNNLRSEATPLPENFRLGALYNFNFESLSSGIQLACGYLKYNSSGENHFQMAGEIVIKKSLALRCGYVTGFDSKSLTAGAGINWGSFNFDYAFIPYKYDLGNSHTISVSYDFQ
jgi:hypothetical protein